MPKSALSLYSSYYIDDKVDRSAVTNYGGVFPYLDLMRLTDLPNLVNEGLPLWRVKGWKHSDYIAALLALNLVGGDCVDDLLKLEGDPGISLYMGQIARATGVEKRSFSRGGERDIPSLTSVREWLSQFHNAEEDSKRGYGEAFVPEANEALRGLDGVNGEFVKRGFLLYERSGKPGITRATLEIDATYMETQKKDALRCYKKYEAFSALTVRWAETGFSVLDEFRDGNVPPGYRNLEALRESIAFLNELGITDVWMRGDSAADQESILKELSGWEIDDKPSPVNFAIGYIKSKDFRKAIRDLADSEWEKIYDAKGHLLHEVAEVPFVSNKEALIKAEPYRHIVIRREAKQGILPGFGESDKDLGYEETMEMRGRAYHIHAIISNICEEWENEEIVEWYSKRCGGGEAIHSIIKSDLAGGQLPSGKFGANAAWWKIAVLAHNLHVLLDKLTLPESLAGSRFKRLRYHLINVPARLVQHARQCSIRFFQEATLGLVLHIRGEMAALAIASG